MVNLAVDRMDVNRREGSPKACYRPLGGNHRATRFTFALHPGWNLLSRHKWHCLSLTNDRQQHGNFFARCVGVITCVHAIHGRMPTKADQILAFFRQTDYNQRYRACPFLLG